jgi:ubiquinone/menaquinone biosynthesis C-methylase UbiE
MATDETTVQWYNEHADEYTHHVRNPDESVYHSLYEKPAMYALLPDLQGKSAISIGCGSGEDAHYLKAQGAEQVVGIDISSSLIDIAKNSYPECDFKVMDMEKLDFDDESFDFAYSSLALHYLEDWTDALSEAYRVLKRGSNYLFSCGHPLYSSLEITQDDDDVIVRELSRTKDKKLDTVSAVGDYFTHRSITFNGWTTWHKPIDEISAEIAKSGFVIAAIHEPHPLPKMKEISPKDYDTLVKMPNFIIFKLLKV